jgi:RimJ/RimL family protein N-acetyltransferase
MNPSPAPPTWVTPVTLEGTRVRLEPLAEQHLEGILDAAQDPGIWTWMPGRLATRDDVEAWSRAALAGAAGGTELPFTTIDRASGRVIGSTRYLAITPLHRRLEIGWTWLNPAWQRTGANRDAKRLMLGHAFETLGAIRVEFKTDARNERSRAAILALGATFEGIHRHHMLMPDGRLRDSAWYSILAGEWPAVRARLETADTR